MECPKGGLVSELPRECCCRCWLRGRRRRKLRMKLRIFIMRRRGLMPPRSTPSHPGDEGVSPPPAVATPNSSVRDRPHILLGKGTTREQ